MPPANLHTPPCVPFLSPRSRPCFITIARAHSHAYSPGALRLDATDKSATLAEEEHLRESLKKSIAKLKAQLPLNIDTGGAALSCSTDREATLACYREHPTEPLKCRVFAQQFVACSRKHRTKPAN